MCGLPLSYGRFLAPPDACHDRASGTVSDAEPSSHSVAAGQQQIAAAAQPECSVIGTPAATQKQRRSLADVRRRPK